ncbi:flagellar assembly protein FliH [Oceanisphaera avium]|uniref:Flagellar assembly protein FliH n=1 Tax=Oceanisphaera avium TaxID=1903694 RepID=A0A1Y0CWM4_9GAMM|nr:flagellar assembly protein FliH [Oceanisphaera avium]ART79731.1 flagellar assembly protein FliH [Oceanisphaera avium]
MSRHPYGAKPGRIPAGLNPDIELDNWAWPDLSDANAAPVADAEQALNIKRQAALVEEVPDYSEEPEPLTAEALEEIRQAAYEEGFAQGKQEGIAAGQEEGRLTGLQQGHEAGLSQGKEEGLEEGRAQIAEQVAQWQQLISQLQAPLAQVDKVVEQSLVTLAIELARNLLKQEATTSPQLLLATVQEAISALPNTEHHGDTTAITLYVHPEDLTILEAHFDERSLAKRHWQLISEPSLARGDVKVKTALSELDVSLARRIDELMANFLHANWARFHGTD